MHQQCSRQIPVNGGKLGELSPPLLLVHYRTFSWSRVTGGQGAQPLFTIRRKIILFIFLASSSSGAGSPWEPRRMRSLVLDAPIGIGRDKCGLGKSLYEHHSFGIDFNEIGHTNHTNG